MPILSSSAVIPLLGAMLDKPGGLLHQSTFPGVGRSEQSQLYLGQAWNHISIIARPHRLARSALASPRARATLILMDDNQKLDVALTGEEEHDCEHRVALKEDALGCPPKVGMELNLLTFQQRVQRPPSAPVFECPQKVYCSRITMSFEKWRLQVESIDVRFNFLAQK